MNCGDYNTELLDAKPSDNILLEANNLVSGDRQAAYGHPLDNFQLIADFWNAHLSERIRKQGYAKDALNGFVLEIVRPEDVGLMMILLKTAREINSHKVDNLVDIPGYAKTVQMIHEERERRG
jgi:hypothetical protein